MGCKNHPAVDAGLAWCWVCGDPFCGECVVEFQGRTMCAPCKSAAVARLEQGIGVESDRAVEKAPWERRAELGLVKAFVETTKASMLRPAAFFSRLDPSVGTYACLGYAMIVQVLVAISAAAVQFAMLGTLGLAIGAPGGASPGGAGILALMAGGYGLLGILIAPIAAILQTFIFAGLVHIALLVMKKNRLPYHQTYRGYCYATGPSVLGVVPFVGPMIGGLWTLVATILMVKEMHRTTGGVAAISVLWIVGVGFCCGMVAVLGMGLALSGAR